MTLPPHYRKNEPPNNPITTAIAQPSPNSRTNRRTSKRPTHPARTPTPTATHFLMLIPSTKSPFLHSPPQHPPPNINSIDTEIPRPVGRVAGKDHATVLSEGMRQGDSLPPYYRSPIPTTPLTASHVLQSTPSTQTPPPQPPPQDPPPDIGVNHIAPPWPVGRVAIKGYVPVLSDHDRGFMRPRPTRMKGGRYRDESDASRRWSSKSQQRPNSLLTRNYTPHGHGDIVRTTTTLPHQHQEAKQNSYGLTTTHLHHRPPHRKDWKITYVFGCLLSRPPPKGRRGMSLPIKHDADLRGKTGRPVYDAHSHPTTSSLGMPPIRERQLDRSNGWRGFLARGGHRLRYHQGCLTLQSRYGSFGMNHPGHARSRPSTLGAERMEG